MKHFYRLFKLKQRINGFTILCEEPTSYRELDSNKILVAKTWIDVFKLIVENAGDEQIKGNVFFNVPQGSSGFGEYPTEAFSDSTEKEQLIFETKCENGWLIRFKVKENQEDTFGYWFEYVALSSKEKDEIISKFRNGEFRNALKVKEIPRLAEIFEEVEEDDFH